MKKTLLIAFFALFFVVPAQAFTRGTVIPTTTLNADPISVSGTVELDGKDRTIFFVHYDETEVGGISVAVTVYVSYDNTNWLQANFYDYAGGATLQTSETLSSDTWYYFALDPNISAPYVKVTVAATGSDADDTADITCYYFAKE